MLLLSGRGSKAGDMPKQFKPPGRQPTVDDMLEWLIEQGVPGIQQSTPKQDL